MQEATHRIYSVLTGIIEQNRQLSPTAAQKCSFGGKLPVFLLDTIFLLGYLCIDQMAVHISVFFVGLECANDRDFCSQLGIVGRIALLAREDEFQPLRAADGKDGRTAHGQAIPAVAARRTTLDNTALRAYQSAFSE